MTKRISTPDSVKKKINKECEKSLNFSETSRVLSISESTIKRIIMKKKKRKRESIYKQTRPKLLNNRNIGSLKKVAKMKRKMFKKFGLRKPGQSLKTDSK